MARSLIIAYSGDTGVYIDGRKDGRGRYRCQGRKVDSVGATDGVGREWGIVVNIVVVVEKIVMERCGAPLRVPVVGGQPV